MQQQVIATVAFQINSTYTDAQMDFIPVDQLAVWHHVPSKKPRGRVLLVHGIGEHSGRHLNTVENLLGQNLQVVRFDLRGSGRSGGLRQWVDTFDDYVADVSKVFNWIQSVLEPLPLFLFGHSLGGCISLYFAALYGPALRGLLLSAPAHEVGDAYSRFKITVGKIMAKTAPHFRLARAGDPQALSRDNEVVEAFLKDPLCCSFSTLRQGSEILNALPGVPGAARRIQIPTVIFHGSMDRVIRLSGSFSILQALGSPAKLLHILPGGYHELHNDLDKAHYFSLMNAWLRKQLPGRKLLPAP